MHHLLTVVAFEPFSPAYSKGELWNMPPYSIAFNAKSMHYHAYQKYIRSVRNTDTVPLYSRIAACPLWCPHLRNSTINPLRGLTIFAVMHFQTCIQNTLSRILSPEYSPEYSVFLLVRLLPRIELQIV